MPNLCFKTRHQGRTVQLVRHIYSPAIQRSKTVTLGSLRLDADPDDLMPALRLRIGATLTEKEHVEVRQWLLTHGNREAAERRRQTTARIESQVRAAVEAELVATSGDVLERAAKVLADAAMALPMLAEQARAAGQDVRTLLRPSYLDIHDAWERLMKVAQDVGVAKRAPRSGKAKLLAPLPDIADA